MKDFCFDGGFEIKKNHNEIDSETGLASHSLSELTFHRSWNRSGLILAAFGVPKSINLPYLDHVISGPGASKRL